mmetsp:Transcript_132255/g.411092  ORF Transcript_132255/g.411092 Transcript_132255/m.411092 type:complete len:289 (-) Transcript_132255:1228-2094(-)
MSSSNQIFCVALTPRFRQASAKSLKVTKPLWSASRALFQAEKMLPYFVFSIRLKFARSLTITSCSWCFWVLLLMSAAGNLRSYLRAAFGDQGSVKDSEASKSECVWEGLSPPSPWVPDRSAVRFGDGEREGEDGDLSNCDGERPGEEGDRGRLDDGLERWRGEAPLGEDSLPLEVPRALGSPVVSPAFVPLHVAGRSGGDTPIKSDRRSSWTITRWKRRANSIWNSFLALHLCSKPSDSQERRKSSSPTRPMPSGSKPLRQASQMDPKRSTRSPRALSIKAWASASMS